MAAGSRLNHVAEAAALLMQLHGLGTPERAEGEKAYLRSELQFVGTGVPAMRAITKAWLKAHPGIEHDDLFAMADALWAHPVHECRLAAVELVVSKPALVTLLDVPWLYNTIRDCHTWALVDPLAGWVTAELALRDPDGLLPHLDRWVGDEDFWVRRSAMLGLRSLLKCDRELDRCFDYSELLLPETEFFIRKVIGWVLREVAGRHPAEVSNWLRAHMSQMNLITLREPMRRLPDADELRAVYDSSGSGSRRKSSG